MTKINKPWDKIIRFICSGVLGYSAYEFGYYSIFNYSFQWQVFYLGCIIMALGLSILICVWDCIDIKNT